MDELFRYKSTNMAFELDIAGEFLYRGIREFDTLKAVHNNAQVFMILYNIAVGIERIQKIICVLWTMDQYESDTEFEKSLITHSHMDLQKRISSVVSKTEYKKLVEFEPRINSFFRLLTEFYNSCRYMRYNVQESKSEYDKICDFIKENTEVEYNLNGDILLTKKVRKLWGRVIGTIVRNYYELIKIGSFKNNVYAYELNPDSSAQKVLWRFEDNPNCSTMLEDEKTSLKEFLVYYRNNKDKNAFLKFVDEIEPLEYDPAFTNEYIELLCHGEIPQQLVDETEYLYEDIKDVKNRLELINCVGNTMCDFGFCYTLRCIEIIQGIIESPEKLETEIKVLSDLVEYTDDYELINNINTIKRHYDDNVENELRMEDIISELNDLYNEYKR